MKNRAIICKSCCFSSKYLVAQLSTISCYKNASYLERCSARLNLLLTVHSVGDFATQHTFSALRRLKLYLEGTMNMKQDRRLNNGLLMNVNNLIMNDPDTVKAARKQTVFLSTQLCKRNSGKFEQRYTLGLVYEDAFFVSIKIESGWRSFETINILYRFCPKLPVIFIVC